MDKKTTIQKTSNIETYRHKSVANPELNDRAVLKTKDKIK